MSPAVPVACVVFDIGGVLVTSPLGEFAKVDVEYVLAEGTAMSFFRGGSLFAQCEIGALPFADFCAGSVAQIEAEQGIAVPADRLAAMMAAIMGDTIVESMRDLIGEIKAAGLRTGLLSNIYAELDGWMRAAFADDLIDVYCPSYAIGLRKPDPQAYRVLVEMVGLPAERIVFIDDFPENVTAADDAGLRGILFTGEAQLRRELRALGVEVSAYQNGPPGAVSRRSVLCWCRSAEGPHLDGAESWTAVRSERGTRHRECGGDDRAGPAHPQTGDLGVLAVAGGQLLGALADLAVVTVQRGGDRGLDLCGVDRLGRLQGAAEHDLGQVADGHVRRNRCRHLLGHPDRPLVRSHRRSCSGCSWPSDAGGGRSDPCRRRIQPRVAGNQPIG